jgi:hypothetical protein
MSVEPRHLLYPALLLGWLSACSGAQSPDPEPSPYASSMDSRVRGLSAQEVEDLLAGRGMGLARAAELNGYPGPRHVLDLKAELALDARTIEATERLFSEMQAAAKPLGAQVVKREKALNDAFAAGAITTELLEQQVDALAALMGQLRAVHLRAHVATAALLTRDQIAEYDRLRGYSGEGAAGARPEPAMAGAPADHEGHGAHHGAAPMP